MRRVCAGLFVVLSSCRACDEAPDVDKGKQPPMPTGLLVASPPVDADWDAAARRGDVDAFRLLTSPPTGIGHIEMRTLTDGSVHIVTLATYELFGVDAQCGKTAFAWRCSGEDLERFAKGLEALGTSLAKVDSLSSAKSKWPESDTIAHLASDAAWNTAREVLAVTVRKLAALARELRAKDSALAFSVG